MPRAALAVALAAVIALPAAAGASTPPNRERVHLTRADQAAARVAVLRRSDLGSPGWAGGSVKPDLSSTLNCPGYTPRQSDLVLTGAAEADFHHTALQLQSVAQVLQTRAMVARDWQRTVVDPRALSCLRHAVTRGLTTGERLVSFRKIAFPRLAAYSTAFRAVVEFRALGKRVQVLADVVLVGRSRTELTLSLAAPAAASASISRAEIRLARLLLNRVQA
jgi:hypothetical protein